MATVMPLAVLAAASATATPRTCISGAPVATPFLGNRVCLRLRSPPRGVACALRRRPSKYKVTNIISHPLLNYLVLWYAPHYLVFAWMNHELPWGLRLGAVIGWVAPYVKPRAPFYCKISLGFSEVLLPQQSSLWIQKTIDNC